jgi:ABC-2 type transport system ATP-binding protein
VYGIENDLLTERKNWVLEIADLRGKEKILTASLPGGIKQRLALGTAVIHKPGIVFLDEPTSGVDPISRRAFWDLINTLSEEGTTIFVTTHYLEEAEYCGNIILINEGKLIAEGNSKELKTKYLTNTILEVECTPVIEALSILEKAPFVDETSIFGNQIHIIVNDKYSGKQQVESLLTGKEIKVTKVESIVPSLEDVFIHLLEKK